MSSTSSLPHVPKIEIKANESCTRYSIYLDGDLAVDPQEGLPLDSITTRAAAVRIAARLTAF